MDHKNVAVSMLLILAGLPSCIYAGRSYPRAKCLSVCLSVCPSVPPSVCLSNAWIVTNRKKLVPTFLYHTKECLS